MGINIGICETEAPSAPCRELRANIVKVHLDDPTGYEQYMERDVKVDLERRDRPSATGTPSSNATGSIPTPMRYT